MKPATRQSRRSFSPSTRFWAGLFLAVAGISWLWWPDIPGGLRYRFDPFVREAASSLSGQQGTADRADALHEWLHSRSRRDVLAHEILGDLDWVTSGARGGCRSFCETYVQLGLALGLRVRPVYTFWPTIGNPHYWVEVWSPEDGQWHPYDVSAYERKWSTPWMHRVPKAVTMVPTAHSGSWAGHLTGEWELLENTIAKHYPSGVVEIEVRDGDAIVPHQRIVVEVWLGDGMGGKAANATRFHTPEVFSVFAAHTGSNGMVSISLGRSAQQPYRVRLDKPGMPDWRWVAVQSNSVNRVILRRDLERPFDRFATPPKLPWFQDEVP